MATKSIKREKTKINCSASVFLLSQKPKTENFSFPPDTNFEKESDNQKLESKTAFGFDFLKQNNSAKLVSG